MKRVLVITMGLVLVFAAISSAQPAPQNPTPTTVGPNFVDNNGDGICDLYQQRGGQRAGRGGYGPRDGSGSQGVGPRDGTGYGPGPSAGGGTCDGTGPKGKMYRRGGSR
jgi:hypothetical protein